MRNAQEFLLSDTVMWHPKSDDLRSSISIMLNASATINEDQQKALFLMISKASLRKPQPELLLSIATWLNGCH